MTELSDRKADTRIRGMFKHQDFEDWDQFHEEVQNDYISQASLLRVPNFGRATLNRLMKVYKEKYNAEIPRFDKWQRKNHE